MNRVNKVNRVKTRFLILGLGLIMTIIILVGTENLALMIIPAWIMFAYGVAYCVNDWEENIFLFCFLFCIFTFLLCGHTINKFYQVYGYNFSDEIEFHADISIFISLLALMLGYMMARKFSFKIGSRSSIFQRDYNGSYYRDVRYVSKVLYYITYILWLITLFDNILFVIQKGYTNFYLSYSSRVPSYIREFAYMCPMAFYIFLATMPEKKEAKIPMILYLIYSVLSLGTGRRIHFVVGILFIFAYMIIRNSVNTGKEKWISKTGFILICASIPVIIILMYLFEYVRSDLYVGSSEQYSPILGFFIRQGTSINVIKYGELYKSSLNPDAHYSFYNTLQWFQNSFLAKIFSSDMSFEFGKQSVSTALNGTYLADFVSYKANRVSYEIGMGYGSCYIEELYIDYGYKGIFLGNVFYGMLLGKLAKNIRKTKNVWVTALIFFAVNEIFKAPRATFDACFGRLLYFSYWGPIALIWLFVYLSRRNKKMPLKRQVTKGI